MSLRSVGYQLLQTSPSRLLAGATKVSASFWIRVNPANNDAGATGVEVFGEAGGRFSATLSALGSLKLSWTSNDGHSNGASSCTLNLTLGASYHIAATWQSGTQQYFLNGVQVATDTKVGSLGVLGDTTTYPFRLGSDQPGTDVTVDQPTLWVGYALTAQDVLGLRNRSVQPAGIASASIALGWSLAGADGAAAKVGDAGLADSSPNALALSSIVGVAPTYQAGDLIYVAPTSIGGLIAAPSGQSIMLLTQDQDGAAANVTSIASSNEVQSITFLGSPAGGAFALSFGGQATAPIPTSLSPPASYALWTVPTTPGETYTFAVSHADGFSPPGAPCLYEVLDNGVVVATSLGSDVPTNQFTDPGVTVPGGAGAVWNLAASGIIASGTSLQVRQTGTGTMIACGLRIQDTGTGAITYYDVTNSAVFTRHGSGSVTTGFAFDYGGARYLGTGTGLGPIVGVIGGGAALQAALVALSSVGPGGVSVADLSGSGTGHYQVTFAGANVNQAWPLFTCPDANVAIAEVAAGGNVPTLVINGGSPIPLADWLWTTHGGVPAVIAMLPQSAPAVQTLAVGHGLVSGGAVGTTTLTGGWFGQVAAGSLSAVPLCSATAGSTLTAGFQILPTGTYQLAIAYPNGPFTNGGTGYAPSTATPVLVKDASGNTLATYSVDQSVAPSDYTDTTGLAWHTLGSFTTNRNQNGLTVEMTTVGLTGGGGNTPVAILDGIQLVRTSADTSVVIGPSDVATVSFPAGWMTTSAGPLPATPNVAVTPPSAHSILPPFAATPKAMKLGYNVNPGAYYQNLPVFANLARCMIQLPAIAQDADGYPLKLAVNPFNPAIGSATGIVYEYVNNPVVDDPIQGTLTLATGRWRLAWDGAITPGVSLTSTTGTTVTVVSMALNGAAGNEIIYDVEVDPALAVAPFISWLVQSNTPDPSDSTGKTFLCDVTNLRIYPPDPADPTGMTPWSNPPKFHPWFLAKQAGIHCLRLMDTLGVNANATAAFAHYKPETLVQRAGPWINTTVPVTTIKAPTAPIAPGYTANYGMAVQVTTAQPHNLFDGCLVSLVGTVDVPLAGGGTFSASNGRTLDQATQGTNALCEVVYATTVILYLNNFKPGAMTGSVTPTGVTLNARYGSTWSLKDVTDLVRDAGYTELWFNVAVTDDASPGGCVDQVAAFLLANLPAGTRVHVELGNECWNTDYFTCHQCAIKDAFITGNYQNFTYQQYYVQQAKAVHDRFLAIYGAAGKAADVSCVYGGSEVYAGGGAADILGRAAALGARVDEYCTAVYFNNSNLPDGFESSQLGIYERMTADQCMDFMEFNAVHGQMDYYQSLIAAAIAASPVPSTRLVAYEGSPAYLVPSTSAAPNFYPRQNAVKRNPRMYGVMLAMCQNYADAGLKLWNYFGLFHESNDQVWEAWEWGNQQPGTGNPALDVANATNPRNKNAVKAEIGGALKYWASLVPKRKTPPGRNGQIGSTGFPRGQFRTIR